MICEYNKAIIPLMIDYVKNMIERVEVAAKDSIDDVSIKLKKYVTVDTNNLTISYLTSHGLTGYFTLKLYYDIKVRGESFDFDEDLNIPKMINNAFVIDGSLRVSTNSLDNDNEINVYADNLRINESLYISYTEDPHRDWGYLLVANYWDEDGEKISFEVTPDSLIQYQYIFGLSDTQRDKLKVKLDTDDIGENLTMEIILGLVRLGLDKHYDNMIDKKIYSAESNLMKYMWSRDVRRRIISKMRDKFYQYNKIFIRDIQNAIDRYFRIASEKNIAIPNSTNPIGFDSLRYKILIPESVAYNSTMTDIIDVANTPINQNVNKINELNVCTVVRNNTIYIKCYKYPSQEPIEMEYTKYCTKKVLLNNSWNYDKKEFTRDEPRYKLRMKTYSGTVNDKFDLIEPKADDKLSITSRRIPFGNMSDSVRVSMGTTMMKQSVELENSEPPLVTAGYDDTDYELSMLATDYQGSPGIVTKIEDNKIYIKDEETGSITFYDIPSPMIGINDTIVSFDTNIKVGDKVTEGMRIIDTHSLRRKSFELGLNANVVYLNYLGYTYEDGVVISSGFAKKLTHYSILNVILPLYPDDIVQFIKKIGSKITSRDILVNNQSKLRVSSSTKNAYGEGGILGGLGISYSQNNLLCPNNVDLGYVVDVRVQTYKDRELTSEYTNKIIEEYAKSDKVNEYESIPDRFKELKADEFEVTDSMAGYISVKIVRVDEAKIGDKLTNVYGGKGVISLVLPNECMPQIHRFFDGIEEVIPAEVILNPAAVLHRKNISQLYECGVNKCIEKIYHVVNSLIKENKFSEAKEFLRKYYGSQFDSMSDNDFKVNHYKKGIYAYQMKVGFFSKFTRQDILDMMKDLGVTETEKIFLPSIVIAETKEGLKVSLIEKYQKGEFDRNIKHYELGWCENECVTGREYILKLHHSASYSGKATPYIFDTPNPVMGRGVYREAGGQSIGEMESWILLETGTEKFLQDQSPDMITNQFVFLQELLMAGYYIEDRNKNPLLSQAQSNQRAIEELTKK